MKIRKSQDDDSNNKKPYQTRNRLRERQREREREIERERRRDREKERERELDQEERGIEEEGEIDKQGETLECGVSKGIVDEDIWILVMIIMKKIHVKREKSE